MSLSAAATTAPPGASSGTADAVAARTAALEAFPGVIDAPSSGIEAQAPGRPHADTGRAGGRGVSWAPGTRAARTAVRLLAITGDIGAWLLAYAVVMPFAGGIGGRPAQVLLLAAVVALVLHASESLYPGYRILGHEQLRRRVTASCKAALFTAAAAVVLTGEWRLALFAVAFLALALVLQPVAQQLARRAARRLGLWGEAAVVLADPARSAMIARYFSLNWQLGIRPEPFPADQHEALRLAGRRLALIADAAPSADELAVLRRQFAEIILVADTPNLKISGLRPIDIRGEIGVRLAGAERQSGAELLRRILDLAVALPAALVAAPVIALAGAAIYAIDPGPIFFRQKREGLSGRTIRVLKLRTMYRDAEERLEALFREEPAMKAEWQAHFKLRRDPRILPVVGSLLRSSSCDEVPQLFNVILGEMSLVGPRPFPDYHLLAMNAEFRHKRRSVVPGLTGLWQISERSQADIELQRQLDEFYIDNRSLWLDWHILLKTIPAVLRRSGAY